MTVRVATRDRFIANRKRRMEWVNIPELAQEGEDPAEVGVYVRAMTSAEIDDWETASVQVHGKDTRVNTKNMRARLVVATACDADGELIFSSNDAQVLGEQDVVLVDRAFDAAVRLNRLTKKDAEDLGKGSEPTRNGSSDAASP